MRTIEKLLLAGLLALSAASASAVPVQVGSTFVQWHSDEYARSNADLLIGDCRSLSPACTGFEHEGLVSAGTPDAPVTSFHHGVLDTATAYTDNATDFAAHAFLEASASVAPGLPGGEAMAAVQLYRFISTFEVFEPVIYTGTFGLYAGDALYDPPSPTGPILSGMLLQPGFYNTNLSFDGISTGFVSSDSVSVQQQLQWAYRFTAVPGPAPLLLVATGLLALVGYRRKQLR